MSEPGGPKVLTVVGVLASVLVGLVLAGWAAGAVLDDRPGGLDAAVLDWFTANRSSALTTAARAVTQLGGTAVLVPMAVLAGIVITIRGRVAGRASLRVPVFLAVVFVGAEVIMRSVKAAAGRARPPADLAVGHFVDPAFPSAHVMLAVTMLGAVAVVVAGGRAATVGSCPSATRQWTTWSIAGTAMVAVALTRMYLGAHWLTDVVGGAVLAGAWLVAVAVVIRPTPSGPGADLPFRTGVALARPSTPRDTGSWAGRGGPVFGGA